MVKMHSILGAQTDFPPVRVNNIIAHYENGCCSHSRRARCVSDTCASFVKQRARLIRDGVLSSERKTIEGAE